MMLRGTLLFASLGVDVMAKTPHRFGYFPRGCSNLSQTAWKCTDQGILPLINAFRCRGGSNVEATIVSNIDHDAGESTYGEDYDVDDGDAYDSSDGDTLEEEFSVSQMDNQYFMPSSVNLVVTLGCMMLSSRIDFFNPTFVRIVRLAFIIEVLIQQLFILYVRLIAKRTRDMSKVDTSNPVVDMLMSQMQLDISALELSKRLTSSFLSSDMTAMEYDLKQASDMQGGVVLNMLVMWFLHFKLEKIQPLLIQVLMGFAQLVYSPLFQVYILGRNLERPFKSPKNNLQGSMASSAIARETERDDGPERWAKQ